MWEFKTPRKNCKMLRASQGKVNTLANLFSPVFLKPRVCKRRIVGIGACNFDLSHPPFLEDMGAGGL